jgi:TPR repeat protein
MNRIARFSSFAFAAGLTLSAAGPILNGAAAADKAPHPTKDGSNERAVDSGCFIARDHGQSLEQASCDVRALQASAKEGQVYAQNQLGLVSAMITGPGTGIRQARTWFEKAAHRGYAPAQVNLAVTYINGWGGEQNYGAALYWLNAAAKQGSSAAYANLGILYMNGWGVRRDYAEARKYLELAAKAGDSGAASNLGYLYDGGLGVMQDYSAAARWYRTAAEKGNALGQNNLADLYLRGQGVQQSYSAAARWFEKAAHQGHTGARIKFGFLLMHGMGVQKDTFAAYSWILAASKAGDHRGDEYLPALQSTLDQQKLAQVTEHSTALTEQSVQLTLRSSLLP